MQKRNDNYQNSPFLKGDYLTSSIQASDHMKNIISRSANLSFKPWNNKYTPFAPQSPFGDFPKDYLQNVEKTRVSPLIRNSKNILGKLTQGISDINSRMSSKLINSHSPPKAGGSDRRLIPISEFRRYYDRGDLPIKLDYARGANKITWKINPDSLDYHHYLPIFIDGVREKVDPYRNLSILGTFDLIEKGGDKILPVVPQLIIPLKINLNTRDPEIICLTLRILQKLVLSGNNVGEAFVPYYRQLLPIMNQFKSRYSQSNGNSMDYQQRNNMNLGENIQDTLEILEKTGGDDAYINIKYMIPTYESCLIG